MPKNKKIAQRWGFGGIFRFSGIFLFSRKAETLLQAGRVAILTRESCKRSSPEKRSPTHSKHLHRNSGECAEPSPELWCSHEWAIPTRTQLFSVAMAADVVVRKSLKLCLKLCLTWRFVLPALLQKLVGELSLIFRTEIWREIWREFCWIFLDPQNKRSKISGNFS